MESTTCGYVRISTQEQNEARQPSAMREFGVSEKNIIVEKMSGKDFVRPLLYKPPDGFKRLTSRMKYCTRTETCDRRALRERAEVHPPQRRGTDSPVRQNSDTPKFIIERNQELCVSNMIL